MAKTCSEERLGWHRTEQVGADALRNAQSCRLEASGNVATCTSVANWLVILTGCRRKSCGTSHLKAVNFILPLPHPNVTDYCRWLLGCSTGRQGELSVGSYQLPPPEAVKILVALFLSFLIGLEREEHKTAAEHYSFGGIRTFPLIGLAGYSIALLSGSQIMPLMVGFLVVGSFLLLSYWRKLSVSGDPAGVTSEISGLVTFLVGALASYGHLWTATFLTVASLLLLELKEALEKLPTRIPSNEILTFAKFLLLTAVVLPIVPREEFGRFHISPFKTWLVVVAVSTISYASYIAQKLTKGRGGVLLAGFLGGAYSSTVTTVALSRRAKTAQHPHLFAAAILVASGAMYLRLLALLALFNRPLASTLLPAFMALATVAIGVGWLWSRKPDATTVTPQSDFEPSNPLELTTAFVFALVFVTMLIATQLALAHMGRSGLNTLAAIMGIVDVDPFVMGITQATRTGIPLRVAAAAIVVAASSNNLAKGIYAYSFGDKKTGAQSFCLLAGLAAVGLIPLIWL
jgi:uncharacterized membrane protein (DUF4010 family)